jgi:Bacterial regulatory proteins, luxR family
VDVHDDGVNAPESWQPGASIGNRLGLATATVGNHITSIFAKLQVASRAEAIVRARSAGLGGPATGS